jgi:hypothetical protein
MTTKSGRAKTLVLRRLDTEDHIENYEDKDDD